MAKQTAANKASSGLGLDAKTIDAINKSYATTNAEAKKQLVTQSALKDLADEIKDSWGDLSQVLLKVNDYSKKLGTNFGDVEDIAKKLVSNIENVGTELYEQLEVGDKIKKLQQEQGKRLSEFKKANKALSELALDQEKLDKEKNTMSLALYNNQQKILDAKKDELTLELAGLHAAQKTGALQITALHALKDAADAMDMANEHAKKLGFNIENATNTVTTKLSKSFDFMEEIPFLSDVIGLDSIKEKLEKNVKDSLVRSMTEGKGAASSLFSAMTTGARTLMTTMGPFLPLIIAAAALYKAFEFDKELTQFSKDLDVSKDTAMGLSIEADAIAGHLGVAGVNGVEVGKAMTTIKNAMGTTAALANKELVGAVSLLQTRIGLSGEEAMALNSTATLLGTNLNDLAASSYDMADGLIGGKEMLQEMAKLPKSLVAGFKGTTQQLQKAIVKGKLFGLTIEQAQKAGEGMLQIEESLQKEMTFNILAGKSMNLNKARQLALEGKTAELQDEILNQAGSLSEFQEMGPMQQKAMADALNMSKDELTEMLTKTQEMADVGLTQAAVEEQMKKSLEDQQSTINGMTDEKKKAYLQDLLNKKKQEEATAKFGDAMTKLTEAFQKTMMPVVEILGDVLGFIGDIISGITHMIEYFNHWTHSTKTVGDKTVEVKNTFGEILSVVGKVGAGLLAMLVTANLIKKAGSGIGGMVKNILPGGGGAKDAATSAAGGGKELGNAKSMADKLNGIAKSVTAFFDILRNAVKGIMGIVTDVFKGVGEALAGFFKAFSSISFTDLIKGAIALGVMGGALWLVGEALQKFADIGLDDLGIAALALIGLTAAVVGLSYILPMIVAGSAALAIMSGALWIFGEAAASVADSMPALASGFKLFGDIDGGNLIGVAAGIGALSLALAGYGAGSALSGIGSAIGSLFDEDPVEKFNRFASIDASKLLTVAAAITALGSALASFSASVASMGDVSAIADTIDEIADSDIKAAAPVMASVTSASGSTSEGGSAAANSNQGSLKEVADLLKQLIAATSQPVHVNIGGKVIQEIEKQTTLRKTYNTKMDGAHGAF